MKWLVWSDAFFWSLSEETPHRRQQKKTTSLWTFNSQTLILHEHSVPERIQRCLNCTGLCAYVRNTTQGQSWQLFLFSELFLSRPRFPAASWESVSHSPTSVWQSSRGSRGPLLTRVPPRTTKVSIARTNQRRALTARVTGDDGRRPLWSHPTKRVSVYLCVWVRVLHKLWSLSSCRDINNSSPSLPPPLSSFPAEKMTQICGLLQGGVCVCLDCVKQMRS